MAQITDDSLRSAITERLQAVHVEVTDMSGTFYLTLPLHDCASRDCAALPRYRNPPAKDDAACLQAPSDAATALHTHRLEHGE